MRRFRAAGALNRIARHDVQGPTVRYHEDEKVETGNDEVWDKRENQLCSKKVRHLPLLPYVRESVSARI